MPIAILRWHLTSIIFYSSSSVAYPQLSTMIHQFINSSIVSEYNRNRRLEEEFFFEIIVSKDFRRHITDSLERAWGQASCVCWRCSKGALCVWVCLSQLSSTESYNPRSSISGSWANQKFESGVNAKLFGKPETTAFRRLSELGYFGVGNNLRFLLYSLTIHQFIVV